MEDVEVSVKLPLLRWKAVLDSVMKTPMPWVVSNEIVTAILSAGNEATARATETTQDQGETSND